MLDHEARGAMPLHLAAAGGARVLDPRDRGCVRADHGGNELVLGKPRRRPRHYELAITQYGDIVANFEDFLQMVRYVEHRHPVRHHRPDPLEEPLDLCPLERRGRFVEEKAAPSRRLRPLRSLPTGVARP